MVCKADLLKKLDASPDEGGGIPLWNCDLDIGAIVGTMRVSGFASKQGEALVFEQVEFSPDEGVIQPLAYCIATFPISSYLAPGKSFYLSYDDMMNPDTGKFKIDFGTMQVTSRGKDFDIALEKDELVAGKYLSKRAKKLKPEALLFKISDTIPRDWLFSEPDHLKKVFEMPSDIEKIFVVEEWQHPSMDDVYEEEIQPSTLPDLLAIVDAVCSGNSKPKLKGKPNTSWRRCLKKS